MKSIIQSNYTFHRTFTILCKELCSDFEGIPNKDITILDMSKNDARLADHLDKVGYTVLRLSEQSTTPVHFDAVVGLHEIDMESLQLCGLLHQFKNVMIYLLNIENEDDFERTLNKVSESYKLAILTKKSVHQSQTHFLSGSIGERTYKDWRPMVKYDCLIVE